MIAYKALIKRNIKVFFKDKGTFFTSLATPIILLVLYATFLYNVYRSSFEGALPQGVQFDPAILDGLVGGLMVSSLLAVSTVTVSFCANLCMVQDKATGVRSDFGVAPIKPSTLAISYYISTVCNGLIISLSAMAIGLGYLAFMGWYLSVLDVVALFLDTVLLVLFGTALSSLVCYPLSTQGQLSAVGSIVSAGYGFLCGAYMPISQFSDGLRTVICLLPGTHGTSLLRNHALSGAIGELSNTGFPPEAVQAIEEIADCNLTIFGHQAEIWLMYAILIGYICLLLGAYIFLHARAAKKLKKSKNK